VSKIRRNSWDGLGVELSNRLGNTFKSLPFLAFFLVGVIFIGGTGVWLPWVMDKTNTVSLFESQNLLTYSVAILGTLLVDGFFEDKKKNLAAFGLIIGIIALGLCVFGYYESQTGFSLYVLLGSILSLLIFLFVNVNNDRFDTEEDAVASTTGYPEAKANKIMDKV